MRGIGLRNPLVPDQDLGLCRVVVCIGEEAKPHPCQERGSPVIGRVEHHPWVTNKEGRYRPQQQSQQ